MSLRFSAAFLLRNLEKHYQSLNLIEISRPAILNNFDCFAAKLPSAHIWPVLKSNAYGHGYHQIASILKQRHFDYFVVDSYYEALKIWEVNRQKILLIGSVHPDNLANLDYSKLTITVQDVTTLNRLLSLQIPLNFHLKINTGMNRQGFEISQLLTVLETIKSHPYLRLEGLYSHLADADNPDKSFSQKQLNLFVKAIEMTKASGFNPKFCHLTATAGALEISHPLINTVRLGLGLYGYGAPGLIPALRFTSYFTKIRQLKPGDQVGYGRTFTAAGSTAVGLLPVGYFEGLNRRLSNQGFVKYRDNFLPIIGRICMNLCLVDLGNLSASEFDQVEIISSNPDDKNSIPRLAALCQTIPYEILVNLNESIRRTVID